jgi:hypothetical protein
LERFCRPWQMAYFRPFSNVISIKMSRAARKKFLQYGERPSMTSSRDVTASPLYSRPFRIFEQMDFIESIKLNWIELAEVYKGWGLWTVGLSAELCITKKLINFWYNLRKTWFGGGKLMQETSQHANQWLGFVIG